MTKATKQQPEPEPPPSQTKSKGAEPKTPGRLRRIGGSSSDDWNNILANQAFGSIWLPGSDEAQVGKQFKSTAAYLAAFKAKDELEAMMGTQLFAAHNAAMECYRRAMIVDQTFAGRSENFSQANKLSRTYATLIEALNRHRGKGGQQKVTVEHVHVHEGGQAAIGAFATPGGGGGVAIKSEDQPHGTNATAPQPPLLRSDPIGNVLPIPGHAEREMSPAWGQEPRRAEG